MRTDKNFNPIKCLFVTVCVSISMQVSCISPHLSISSDHKWDKQIVAKFKHTHTYIHTSLNHYVCFFKQFTTGDFQLTSHNYLTEKQAKNTICLLIPPRSIP